VISEQRIAGLAAALVEVGGVVGVTLGGSRARGTHLPASDFDWILRDVDRVAQQVAQCLSQAVLLLAHALHGRDRVWALNEKGLVAAAAALPGAPADFATRAHAATAGLGTDPGSLRAACALASELVDAVAGPGER